MKEPKNRKYQSESWHTPVSVYHFSYIFTLRFYNEREIITRKYIRYSFIQIKSEQAYVLLLCQYLNYLFTIRRLAFPYTTRNDVKQRQHFHIQTIFRLIFRLKLCQDFSTMTTVGLLLKSSEDSLIHTTFTTLYRRII